MIKRLGLFMLVLASAQAADQEALHSLNCFIAKTPVTMLELHNQSSSPIGLDVIHKGICLLRPKSQQVIAKPQNSLGLVDAQGTKQPLGSITFYNRAHTDKSCPVYVLNRAQINNHQSCHIDSLRSHVISFLKLCKAPDKIYFNILDYNSSKLTVSITDYPLAGLEKLLKPYPLANAALSSKPEGHEKRFRDEKLVQHHLDKEEFYGKFEQAYLKSLHALALKPVALKIPKIIHRIWLTNPAAPKLPDYQNALWLRKTMEVCPPSKGWRYIIWINDRHALQDLISQPLNGSEVALESVIEFKLADELNLTNQVAFSRFLTEMNYGAASDILRYEILAKLGGVYTDTDYEFVINPEQLNMCLDFYCGIETDDQCYIGNAVIAAKPDHPILLRCINNIKDYYQTYLANRIISGSEAYIASLTLNFSGPFMFSIAVYHHLNEIGNTDTVFPQNVLYPSYFDKDLKLIKTSWPCETIGVHYHQYLWRTGEKNNKEEKAS